MAGAASFLTLIGAQAAHAQVVPSNIDRSHFQPGARALGMGGTFLIDTDDAEAAAFNPAAIANSGHYSSVLAAEGRTNNVNDFIHVYHSLKDLRNQAGNGDGKNTVSGVQGSFNRIYNYAAHAGASADGKHPGTLTGSLSPILAFAGQAGPLHIGLAAFGGISAEAQITRSGNPNATDSPKMPGTPFGAADGATVSVNGGAVSLTNIAVPIGATFKFGTIGISPKIVRADYMGMLYTASEPTNTVTGTNYDDVSATKFDMDLGYITPSYTPFKIQGALVVRDLLSPTFRLPIKIGSNSAANPGGPSNFDFHQNTSFDAGATIKPFQHLLIAAEVHNLSSTNGEKPSFHLGGELAVSSALLLRAGYDQNRFVAGLGIRVGTLRLDLATSTNPSERVAIGISTRY